LQGGNVKKPFHLQGKTDRKAPSDAVGGRGFQAVFFRPPELTNGGLRGICKERKTARFDPWKSVGQTGVDKKEETT